MKPSAVGIEEGHDADGRDLSVEGANIFLVVVPNLVNNIAEKLRHTLFGRLLTGIVIKLGFVGGLRTNANNFPVVIRNCFVVEWETSWAYKFGTMVGFVLDRFSVCVCVCVCLVSG